MMPLGVTLASVQGLAFDPTGVPVILVENGGLVLLRLNAGSQEEAVVHASRTLLQPELLHARRYRL